MSEDDRKAMRDSMCVAAVQAMYMVLHDQPALGRAGTASEVVLSALHNPGSAKASRAEAWFALALALAASAVTAGKDAPRVTTADDERAATLGLIDGVAEMARWIATEMRATAAAAGEGSPHAVKH